MANQPLVQTVFATGAKDDLAAVDTYKSKPGPKPVNSIQSLSDKNSFDITSTLGGVNTKEALGSVIKVAGGGKLTFDKDVLTQRLLATNSKINTSYRSLSDDGKSGMVNNLDMNKKLVADVNGVKSRVNSAEISSLTGLGNFLGDYTGDKNACRIEDHDAVGGMVGGLVEEGSNLGVSGVWSKITSGITQVPVLTRAAQKAMPTLLANGDLNSIYEVSASPAGKGMGVLYPNIGKDLSSAFGIKMSQDSRNKAGIFNKYLATMNNVFGDWDKFSSNGDPLGINILRMLNGSKAFQDMIMDGIKLLQDNDPKKNYLLHGLYRETTVENEVKRFFPRTVLISKSSPALIKKNSSVDPRTVMRLGAVAGILIFG